MPGPLDHPPARVLQAILVDSGIITNPPDNIWPAYVGFEPDLPDNCVTLFGTDGVDGGRENSGGERQEHHGIQIRIRSSTEEVGFVKARILAVYLDEEILRKNITVDSSNYLVHSIKRTTDVTLIGRDKPEGSRSVHVINLIMMVRKV